MNTSPTILVSLPPDEIAFSRIREACPGCEIRVAPCPCSIEEKGQEMEVDLMRGADLLLCEVPPDNFGEFDQLKFMQLTSAGYEHILHLPLVEKGIRVSNGLGNFDGPIAEWNIMMMLIWQRDFLGLIDNQKHNLWDRHERFQRDLYGATIGFYGYGGIARETARLARQMHLNVWVMTRDGTVKPRTDIYRVEDTGDPEGVLPDRVFDPTQMETFMSGLDYFFVTVSLNPTTTGLIAEKELRMLKPTAVLINPARAQIIEEEALLRCLREQWIRGASLDVHYAYPLPPEHPLWAMPNVILTPHISGSGESPHTLERIYEIFIENCGRYMRGVPLMNALTEAQLSR